MRKKYLYQYLYVPRTMGVLSCLSFVWLSRKKYYKYDHINIMKKREE